jgi:hypothetical protein
MIDCFAQATENDSDGMLRTMVLAEEVPRLALSRFQPRDDVGGKQCQFPVIAS